MNRRGKNHYGTLACGPDYDEGRPDAASGFLVRAVRPRDARPLAREEGHRRVRAGRRISERVEDRQLLHATEQMAADGTGGDPPRPRTRPRPRLRSRSALAVPAEERLRRRRGGRVADPGGARSDPRPGERVSGERPAVAAGAGDLQLCPHAGNNLGLAGDVPHFRRFLRELRGITRKGGRLIGNSRIPGTWSE